MIRIVAVRAAGAVALVLASAAVFLAAPAHAATSIAISSPKSGTVVGNSETPTISGTANVDGPACITQIKLTIVPKSDQPADSLPPPLEIAGNNSQTQQFDWNPTLPANGGYQVRVDVGSQPVCGVGDPGTDSASQPFVMNARPSPPAGAHATFSTDDRSATVTWNPGEPDLDHYTVFRTSTTGTRCDLPDDSSPSMVVTLPNPLSVTDSSLPSAAGTVCYFVQASRPDVTKANDSSGQPADLDSAYSSPASVKVPAGSAATTSTSSSSSTGAGGSTATTAGGSGGASSAAAANDRTTAGQPNLNGFATGLNGAKRGAPKVAQTPDGGFKETLPFTPGTAVANDDQEDGADDPAGQQAVGPNAPDVPSLSIHATSNTNRVHTLGTFAGGLVVTVILGHLLLLRREVNRPGDLDMTGSPGLPG